MQHPVLQVPTTAKVALQHVEQGMCVVSDLWAEALMSSNHCIPSGLRHECFCCRICVHDSQRRPANYHSCCKGSKAFHCSGHGNEAPLQSEWYPRLRMLVLQCHGHAPYWYIIDGPHNCLLICLSPCILDTPAIAMHAVGAGHWASEHR